MQTVIKTTCPVDGEQAIYPDALRIYICLNDPTLTFYVFTCPACGGMQKKSLSHPRLVTYLRRAGCPSQEWRTIVPEAHDESLPRLTLDDVIDFHFALRDWYGAMPND